MTTLSTSTTVACTLTLVLAGAIAEQTARADVTVTEQLTIDALITRIRTTSTERTTTDRQRRDSDGKADGVIGWMVGSMKSGNIVRLDRDLEWRLDPEHKRYQETLFPTAAERAAYKQKMQSLMEKMQQCPAGPEQRQSKCEKSEPKFDIAKTDETALIAGHAARKARLSMTYSCKDVSTGDSCDYVATSDVWLTEEQVPGLDQRQAFAMAHARKLGLDEAASTMAKPAQAAMAPYLDQLKQLSSRVGSLKGTPLKTTFALSYGGPQCAAARNSATAGSGGSGVGDATAQAKNAGTQQVQNETNDQARGAIDRATGGDPAGRVLGAAASAFSSKMIGGLFNKKTEPKPAAAAPAATPGAPVTLMSFTTEIQSVSTDPIPANQFELPPDWKKVVPQSSKDRDEEFTCPKTGG